MSLTDLLPGRRDSKRKHRVHDKLAETEAHLTAVQADNAKLLNQQAATDDYVQILLADWAALDDGWRQLAKRTAAAEITAACMQQELQELRAFKANHTKVSAPPGHRDIDPGDHPTEPTGIHVRPLWDALGIGNVITVPGNSDPTATPRQTTWGAVNQQTGVA